MKIGFDAKRYFVNYTGLGNYSRTLIENLVRYYPDNRYLLFAHQLNPAVLAQYPLSENGVNVHTPGSRLGRINGALWRSFFLNSDLAKKKPDIYHGLSHEIPVGIQKQKGLKTVVTIHDLIFLRYPEYYRWTERAIYLRKFRYACRHADKIVSVSEQTKKDIVTYFGIPEEKIEAIYQSCDPAFQGIMSESTLTGVKAQYQLPDDYILYVGSFTSRKNLLCLIDALSLVKESLDVPLVMIGSGGEYKNRIVEKINRLGLGNRVCIRSDVPNEDLPAIYQLAKLFVYPSFYEGFGIPIIEGMSSQVPVITSRDGCFIEAGGPDSRYIDPDNTEELATAMEEVLTDSGLAARMIEKGNDYIRRFHGQETSTRLIDLYRDLIR